MIFLDLLCFIFQVIPNFELRSRSIPNSIFLISRSLNSVDERVYFVNVAAPLTFWAMIWVVPLYIRVVGSNLATIWTSTSILIFLLIGNREIKEATRPRCKKGVTHFTVLPPDWGSIWLVLVLPLLSHLLLVSQLEVGNLNLGLFSAVVATKEIAWVAVEVDATQFPEAFEQSLFVVSPNAEHSIVFEALGKWPTPSLVVLHPPLGALLLNLFLNELVLESLHCLLDLVLGWSWSLQPWMLLYLFEWWPVEHVVC